MKQKTIAKSLESVGCKCYRPGDDEFETIASQITPLHKIRTELSNKLTLYQDKTNYSFRRNESVNELYSDDVFLVV